MRNGQGIGVAEEPRKVEATFGRKETRPDPSWELEFAASLRSGTSREELIAMFGRFRDGEAAFDYLMRRVLMHALCKSVGNDLQVGPGLVLKHPETMEIGNSVFIGAQAMIQGRFDGICRIGNHVCIGPQAYFDARNMILEDFVGWGPGAKVLGSQHTGEPVDVPIIATPLDIRQVVIGAGADVGTNATVLPGVRVGAHSIIGAGAVVNQDIPDYSIAAGVPARVIRSRKDPR